MNPTDFEREIRDLLGILDTEQEKALEKLARAQEALVVVEEKQRQMKHTLEIYRERQANRTATEEVDEPPIVTRVRTAVPPLRKRAE